MKDRLLRILQEENMTSNKFAELMEVRPSNISHLLAGRNYPNFEFIGRMLLRFPNLNPDWLINANGDMCRDGQKDLFGLEIEPKYRHKDEVPEELNFSLNRDLHDKLHENMEVESELAIENQGEVKLAIENQGEVQSALENQKLITDETLQNRSSETESKHLNRQIKTVEICDNDVVKLNASTQKTDQMCDNNRSNENIVQENLNYNTKDDIIDKIIIFYKDKTFDTYTSR